MTGIPLRFLGRADVLAAGGGDVDAAIGVVRRTLLLLADGRAVMPSETSVPLGPDIGVGTVAKAYALPARVDGPVPVAGVKWAAHRGPHTDCAPSILALTIVNDALDGRPLGIVESALLTVMRTAATTALALETCAPRALRRIAVLGAGPQARGHLAMLAARFSALAEVTLWNRTHAHAVTLAAGFADAPFPVRVERELGGAIHGCDAVLACTAATEPILPVDVVVPGRLVAQIGHHEAPFDAIERADRVVVDQWGDYAATSGKSLFRMHQAGRFPANRVNTNLADALKGARTQTPDTAVYFSSFGLNVLDVALAARVLAQAETLGLGTVLPLSANTTGEWAWH
jgi:ornithine cyclodeaminase